MLGHIEILKNGIKNIPPNFCQNATFGKKNFAAHLRVSVLYFFVYAFAMRERITFIDRVCRAKSQLNFITELATRDQEEGEATVFELGNQNYNSSTFFFN